MTSSALTNNGALRLGVVLLGGVIIYWLWSSSSKGLPKNTKDTQKTEASDKEEEKSDATNELTPRTGTSLVKETRTTTTTTTTTVSKTATESESANEEVEVALPRNIKITESIGTHVDDPSQDEHHAVVPPASETTLPVPIAEALTDTLLAEEEEEVVETVIAREAVIDAVVASAALAELSEPKLDQQEQEQEPYQDEEDELDQVEETDEEEFFEMVFEKVVPRTPAAAPVAQIRRPELEIKEEVTESSELTLEEAEIEADAETPTTLVGDDMDLAKDTLINTENVARQVQTLQEISRVAQHSELNAKAPEFKPSWMPGSTSVPIRTPTPVPRGGTPTQEQVKMKSRCRFWPNCTNKSCKFTHPSSPCRDPENCTFGDRCIFIHPSDMKPRPPRENKGLKKQSSQQQTAGATVRKRRPQSSDSSASMVSVTPEEVWSSGMK
ncbi:hypothetical protein KVV02_005190 [Mortierella alpina]|uniref:C3H1-type domain-containing protein n=1 Tax=Mortierella alpina TaxID=64518 RepID=A0A9P8CZZ3_MORAP|nr:hypothetical protein KVV02_005190 [Mortierella alpina]